MSSSESFQDPGHLGPYRLLRQVGEGSFSRVFEAEDQRDGSLAALKVFLHNVDRSGFVREAGVGLDIRHPNLLHVKDVGYLESGRKYVAYPLARGGSLRQRLDGPLKPTFVRHIILQVARALSLLHRHAIVHRDLKPDNMLLEDDSPFPQLRLGDLGSSERVRNESAQGNQGSPAYMAPEQIQGECDTRADLYALGVVAYELLCGERPFAGTIRTIIAGHLSGSPDLSGLPPAVAAVLGRAMAKEPSLRHPSAYAFARDLDLALGGQDPPWVEQLDLSVATGACRGDRCAGWELWRNGPVLHARGEGAPRALPRVDGRISAELCASHPTAMALRDSSSLLLGLGWSLVSVAAPLYGLPPIVAIERFSGHVATVLGGRKLKLCRFAHDGTIVSSIPLPFPFCSLHCVPGDKEEMLIGIDIQRERLFICSSSAPTGEVFLLPDRVLMISILGSLVTLRFQGGQELTFDMLNPPEAPLFSVGSKEQRP